MTMGDYGKQWKYSEVIDLVEIFGNKHIKCDIGDFVFDKENRIFTTPT